MGELKKSSEKSKAIRGIAVKFYIYAFGFLFVCSPCFAVFGLQSSVNIEDGLGSLSLGVAYFVSFLFALFVTPSLVRRCGCKLTMIAGETTYLIYIAANYYPTAYVMFTAGILLGIGDAGIWTAIQMYNVHFGRLHGKSGSQIEDHYVRKYVGQFFAVVQLGQFLGNGISYAVLYGGKQENNATSPAPDETPEAVVHQYQYCGANDCQSANVTDMNIDQYVPTSRISFYVLVTVYCAMCAVGIVTHVRVLPDTRGAKYDRSQNKQLKKGEEAEEQEFTLDQEKQNTTSRPPSVKQTLKATFRHLIHPKQLLLSPASFYIGFYIVFNLSDVTRAYSSCIVGVEQVGLGLMIYAFASGLTSLCARRIIGLVGRSVLVLFNSVLDTSVLLFCLLWRPLESNAFLIYIIFVAFGISTGCWQNNLIGIYTEYFPENQEISFSVWNSCITIGVGIAFISSSSICVSTKIYFLIGFLWFSVFSYGIAEWIHRAERRKSRRSRPS